MALTSLPPTQFVRQGREKVSLAQSYRDHFKEQSHFEKWFPKTGVRPSKIVPNAAPVLRVIINHPGPSKAQLKRTFDEQVEIWRRDTGHLSSTLHRVTHPSYQRIIGLGPQALPLILSELKARPDFWFWALRAISGDDPTEPQDNLEGAITSWLHWGAERGIIESE